MNKICGQRKHACPLIGPLPFLSSDSLQVCVPAASLAGPGPGGPELGDPPHLPGGEGAVQSERQLREGVHLLRLLQLLQVLLTSAHNFFKLQAIILANCILLVCLFGAKTFILPFKNI